MIVQPTPTNPPTRRRRALARAVLAVPPILLVAAIGVALVGPPTAQVPAAIPVTGLAPSSAAPSPLPKAPADPNAIPQMFGDLTALDASSLLGKRGTVGPATGVALAGYLSVDPKASDCPSTAVGTLGPWCDRLGIISDTPWTGPGPNPASPTQVHVRIPVGVRLPEAFDQLAAGQTLPPMPVLVVGRLTPTDSTCQDAEMTCDQDFVVDRVAWAAGVQTGLTPLIDPQLANGVRPNPFVSALDESDLPLMGVLVWPEDLARVDPEAAATGITGAPGDPVWYLRVLGGAREATSGRDVRWMLLSEPNLRVLASGRPSGGLTAAAGG
jgi:hypothetical protein